MAATRQSEKAKDENLALYADYNRTLRTWLVGFGFGLPALLLTNKEAQDAFLQNNDAELITILLLVGAAAQALMAFANKVIAWCAYRNHRGDSPGWFSEKIARLEDWFWIDVVFDVTTMLVFGYAMCLFLGILGDRSTPPPCP